jgi:hypothetical protein
MLHSSNTIHKSATQVAMRTGWTAPDPRLGAMIQLLGGKDRDLVDLLAIGEGLAGKGLPAEKTPPAFLQIEPARAFGNEDVLRN